MEVDDDWGAGDDGEEWGDDIESKIDAEGLSQPALARQVSDSLAVEAQFKVEALAKGHKILGESDIDKLMGALVSEVAEITFLSVGDTLIVLRHYNFDKTKLLNDWFLKADVVRANAGTHSVLF